jgi:von Willebrand factor type A domain
MGVHRSLLTIVGLLLIVVSPLLADVRTQNIDIVVALDKSLSMEHKIAAVKDWVNSYLIDQVVIPGDYLDIVVFYGKAEVLIHQTIRNDADKAAVKKIISGIRGNGRFTDIGNALDVLKAQIATREKDGRDKYVLLLTDGIQEAPPTSKYYSPDGKFNHEFLANTKTIQEKGWKVMILGIGTETAAKDLGNALSSQYVTITGNLSSGAITQSTAGLFGDVTVQGAVTVAPVGSDGSSALSFTLKPSLTQSADASVTVSRIDARIGSAPPSPILTTPMTITVKKGQEKQARVPVRFPSGLPGGSGTATLSFAFPPGQGFSPSSFDVSYKVKGWVENNTLPLGAGAVLLVIIIVGLILLLRRATTGGAVAFLVLVDESPLSETPMSLGPGHEIFLNETEGSFSLISRRNARSLARFFVKDSKLGMGVLKADRFPKLADVPADVRGESFVLKSEDGRKLDLEIQGRIPAREAAEPRETNRKAEAQESRGTDAKPKKAPGRPRAPQRRKASVTRTGKRAK